MCITMTQVRRSNKTSEQIVVHLAEKSLPAPDDSGLNPAINNYAKEHLFAVNVK